MHYKKILYSFFIIAAICGLSLLMENVGTKSVSAGNLDDVKGFAWADNIGWISFNNITDGTSVDYGVRLNDENQLVGEAWSDNIGWIKFDPGFGGPVGATDPFGAKMVGDRVVGWALACTSRINSDCNNAPRDADWDGWIKFTDTTVQADPDFDSFYYKGAAWGSFLVGWIQHGFCAGTACEPDIDCPGCGGGITVGIEGKKSSDIGYAKSVLNVPAGENFDLRWTSSGANRQCFAVKQNGVAMSGITASEYNGGEENGISLPSGTYTYVYRCVNLETNQPAEATLIVTVGSSGNQCTGTPAVSSNELIPNGSLVIRICDEANAGSGAWNRIPTASPLCSNQRANTYCEYTEYLSCNPGYVAVDGECRSSSSEYEEF